MATSIAESILDSRLGLFARRWVNFELLAQVNELTTDSVGLELGLIRIIFHRLIGKGQMKAGGVRGASGGPLACLRGAAGPEQ